MQHEHTVELIVSDGLKANANRVKYHFEEYKDRYAIGISCFALGYILRKPKTITIVNESTPTVMVLVPEP